MIKSEKAYLIQYLLCDILTKPAYHLKFSRDAKDLPNQAPALRKRPVNDCPKSY